ncbi:MAG TPA: effector-associated domain EAD1-containing protein, partial [Chitinophagaceae bacterium]
FRANLRIALYDLIMKKPEYHGREVHDRAVDYYKDKPNPEDKAEYLYHRLMRGDDPATIESVYSGEVRPYIESSLSELPTSAFVYLATLMGIRVSADKVEQSGLQQWEEYQISQIIDLLKKGDEISLKKICDELSSRPERTYDSPLNYYEAKVLIRLASFKKAETILNKAIAESLGAGNNLRQLNLQVLKSDLYEYQLDFHKAFDTISAAPLLETVKQYMSSSIVGDIESLISGRLAWSRLAKRMGEEHYVSMTEKLYSFIEPFQEIIYGKLKEMAGVSSLSGILPFPYKTYAERLYRYKSDINFRSLFAEMDNSFSNENEFRSMLQRLEKSVTNKLGLEKFLQSRYSLNLKDICEPGSLKINLIDVVKYMELDRNNESSQKNSTKLTGAQINRLIEAILNSFNQHELELILYTRLDKRLLNLMPTHASFHMQVFTLITEAVKNGWDEQLITALLAERPANVELHQIASQRGIA